MKLITILAVSLISTLAFAQHSGDYNVVRGNAKTFAISQTNQLGSFRLVLKSVDKQSVERKIKLKGSIHGTINPNQTLNHVLVNKERTGAIYTMGDTITNPFLGTGDPACANGTEHWQIEETLYVAFGTGEFQNIVPGSTVVVHGTVGNCPNVIGFGRNDFQVVGGSISFN